MELMLNQIRGTSLKMEKSKNVINNTNINLIDNLKNISVKLFIS